MSDLRQHSPRSRRSAEEPSSAWVAAALAVAIMMGVTLFGAPLQGSQDTGLVYHATVLNTPDLVGHPPR